MELVKGGKEENVVDATAEVVDNSVPEGPIVEEQVEHEKLRELSIGEQLIGCNFDIPQEEVNEVVHVKLLSAELANVLTAAMHKVEGGVSQLRADLYKKAMGDILDAQMNIQKVLTFPF